MKQFEIGKKYCMRSACDHNCTWTYEVIKRTTKTVTLQELNSDNKPINRRIFLYNDCESVKPLGSYSMAPVLTAEKEVKSEP